MRPLLSPRHETSSGFVSVLYVGNCQEKRHDTLDGRRQQTPRINSRLNTIRMLGYLITGMARNCCFKPANACRWTLDLIVTMPESANNRHLYASLEQVTSNVVRLFAKFSKPNNSPQIVLFKQRSKRHLSGYLDAQAD